MLFYLAARIPDPERGVHLDALSRRFGDPARTSVVTRARVIADFRASASGLWFGPPVDPSHQEPLSMLAEGTAYGRLAKTAERRQWHARIRSGSSSGRVVGRPGDTANDRSSIRR